MSERSLIIRLHQHRRWVNDKIREIARGLTPAQLYEQYEIGQGSLWKTLTHLYGAEYVWLEALQGNESPCVPGDRPDQLPGNQAGENPIRDVEELIVRWEACESRWQSFLGQLQGLDLEQPVYKISTSSRAGQSIPLRAADVLLHVCTHAQYTTAQFNNMLRQAGVQLVPDVMLITLARQEAGGRDIRKKF